MRLDDVCLVVFTEDEDIRRKSLAVPGALADEGIDLHMKSGR